VGCDTKHGEVEVFVREDHVPDSSHVSKTQFFLLRSYLTALRITIYDWVDKHPDATQADAVKHFATRPRDALTFDQGSLSRNLKKRKQREAEVAANPAALSSKRARVVTRPDVDKALWMWVQDRMSKSRTVSGPELSEKRRSLKKGLECRKPSNCPELAGNRLSTGGHHSFPVY
jgi:hypothetical protein